MDENLPSLYPLTFTPVLRHYIWGGRNLETLLGRELPPGNTAESWEISAHETAATAVDSGPLQGVSLAQILLDYGADLTGSRAAWALERDKFPLLVKLLDAEKRLSVQVHPEDAYAIAHENGDLGKMEMWYVLHARPEARLILGLRRGVTPAAFRQAIADQAVEDWLHYVPVKQGDAILISPGTVHAALEGLVLTEVLQNSDTTYRVHDWGRVDSDGNPRQLHIEKAMDVIDFDQVEQGPVVPKLLVRQAGMEQCELVRCPYFVVEKLVLEAGAEYAGVTNGETFEIWGTMAGHSRLTWADMIVDLPAVRFCLVAASLGRFSLQADSPATMLRIYLPEPAPSGA